MTNASLWDGSTTPPPHRDAFGAMLVVPDLPLHHPSSSFTWPQCRGPTRTCS